MGKNGWKKWGKKLGHNAYLPNFLYVKEVNQMLLNSQKLRPSPLFWAWICCYLVVIKIPFPKRRKPG